MRNGFLLGVVLLAGCKAGPLGPAQPAARPEQAVPATQGRVPRTEYPEERAGRRRSRRGRAQEQAAPGEFDFYLLNLSWSPEFCATHSSPECGRGCGAAGRRWCRLPIDSGSRPRSQKRDLHPSDQSPSLGTSDLGYPDRCGVRESWRQSKRRSFDCETHKEAVRFFAQDNLFAAPDRGH